MLASRDARVRTQRCALRRDASHRSHSAGSGLTIGVRARCNSPTVSTSTTDSASRAHCGRYCSPLDSPCRRRYSHECANALRVAHRTALTLTDSRSHDPARAITPGMIVSPRSARRLPHPLPASPRCRRDRANAACATSSIAATIASCASRSRPAPLPRVEHQRCRPDHRDRVRDELPRDVGRGAVHGFEQRRKLAVGVQVRRRRDADRARTGRPEIRQDVAERFDATTTSKRSGCSTKRAHGMSMCCLSTAMSG